MVRRNSSGDEEGFKRRRRCDIGKEIGGDEDIVVMKDTEAEGGMIFIGKKARGRKKTLCGHTLLCIDVIISKCAFGLFGICCGHEDRRYASAHYAHPSLPFDKCR